MNRKLLKMKLRKWMKLVDDTKSIISNRKLQTLIFTIKKCLKMIKIEFHFEN